MSSSQPRASVVWSRSLKAVEHRDTVRDVVFQPVAETVNGGVVDSAGLSVDGAVFHPAQGGVALGDGGAEGGAARTVDASPASGRGGAAVARVHGCARG